MPNRRITKGNQRKPADDAATAPRPDAERRLRSVRLDRQACDTLLSQLAVPLTLRALTALLPPRGGAIPK